MRESYAPDRRACKAVGKKLELHVKNYGHDIESRLTGAHETAPWDQFSYGVSDRGASIRIPWQVEKDGKGYAEDRRPNANWIRTWSPASSSTPCAVTPNDDPRGARI